MRILSKHLRGGYRKGLLLAAVSGMAVLSAAGIASAGGGSASQAAPSALTITAKFKNGRPFFFYSPHNGSIAQGGMLTIRNASPSPHTFSLVRQSLLPKTRRQRQLCPAPGHICFAIARWHRVRHNTVHLNPVDVGQTGWDTEGGLRKTGDSVFFFRNRPQALPVSAPAGTTLHFMCAIHPWMQGTITVR
jgi:hypothetical protein